MLFTEPLVNFRCLNTLKRKVAHEVLSFSLASLFTDNNYSRMFIGLGLRSGFLLAMTEAIVTTASQFIECMFKRLRALQLTLYHSK